MKKILVLFVALLIGSGVAFADDRPIAYDKVPQNARTFITKHFAKAKVLSSTVDPEFLGGTEYTVYIDGGVKIEFNSKGVWKEIESAMTGIPAGIAPAKIENYIKTNYADSHMIKINLDRTDYEVKLSNGMELKFNLNGDFLVMEMDD